MNCLQRLTYMEQMLGAICKIKLLVTLLRHHALLKVLREFHLYIFQSHSFLNIKQYCLLSSAH